LSLRKSLSLAAAAALALALAATFVALRGEPGFDAVRIGPWTSWPRLGGADIDPYARAASAVAGALPLGSGEGLVFIARADQSGAPLDARCDYEISGVGPPARFWTLAAHDVAGRLRPNKANRYALTSAELLRAADGSFSIAAAREARPGNWLPLGEKSRFTLILRAYQAHTSALADAYEGLTLPTILRGACS
jgi:hypothetical protein